MSDEEAEGNSTHLSWFLLQAAARTHVNEMNEKDDQVKENIIPNIKRNKKIINRKSVILQTRSTKALCEEAMSVESPWIVFSRKTIWGNWTSN